MTDLKLIETERLVLSGWRADQIGDLERLHGDPAVAKYLKDHGQPWSRQEMDAALALWIDLFETHRFGKLRVTRKEDGMLVGRAGYALYAPTGEPELGYALYPEFWGNGYAFEAASALRDWIFRETDWDHFIGMADVRNLPSLAILSAIGMTKTRVEMNDTGQLCQFHIFNRPD